MVLQNSSSPSFKRDISNTSKSSGHMFSEEKNLPKLPVPDLVHTMEKYIDVLEPITSEDDLETTKRIVADFVKPGGVGEVLQAKLLEKAAASENWLSDWWDKSAYLEYRDPVVIHTSPANRFPDRTFHSDIDQFRYAAKLIHQVLKFKRLVETESIPIDYTGKDPLSMVQYQKLLSVCRVPLPKCDDLKYTPSEESRNVIVAHNNHFFSLDVYKEGTNTPLSEEELIQQIASIVEKSYGRTEAPVGVLTCERRENWALGYKRLLKDAQNRKNIDLIVKSICLINLDKPVDIPISNEDGFEDPKSTVASNQLLHGGGTSQNSMNRWYDKIMQFIINRNGQNGLCFEHSCVDGTPVMNLCNMIMGIDLVDDHSGALSVVNDKLKPPLPLTWNLTDDLVNQIHLAIKRVEDAVRDIELRSYRFDKFGKNIPKKYRCSPDAFFQVSLQLAYWRLHSDHPSTYESASLRKFTQGRTECIRSATQAATRFSREMDRSNYDPIGKRKLFLKAIQAHKDYTKIAMNFQAVDSHMIGLKLTAIEDGIPLPEIFLDNSFDYSMHFKLSTSQVPTKYPAGICYGPVVPDGYGVCYNPMENQFIHSVSSFISDPKTCSKDFGDAIAKSLEDLQKLLI